MATIKTAALEALERLGTPSKVKDILDVIINKEMYTFGAKNPINVLNVEILRHCKGVNISQQSNSKIFYKTGPMTYGLLSWLDEKEKEDLENEEELLQEIFEQELKPDATLLNTNLFLEEEWHQWLYKNLLENGLVGLGFGKLRLFDEEKQIRFGRYNTKVVGEIDLLLVSEQKEIIVLELKRRGTDETIGQICRYVGWVEEELAKSNEKVFGIIIAQNIDDKLRYAIKPIKDHIFYQQLVLKVEFGESSKSSRSVLLNSNKPLI